MLLIFLTQWLKKSTPVEISHLKATKKTHRVNETGVLNIAWLILWTEIGKFQFLQIYLPFIKRYPPPAPRDQLIHLSCIFDSIHFSDLFFYLRLNIVINSSF